MNDNFIKKPIGLVICALLTALMMLRAIWMVFMYAPIESQMGLVQKIFYFHVPSAWNMLLSVILMATASIGYLITRREPWDRVSNAAVELAIIFGLMTVISGPLWGRKAWGVYWVWDVRLTSTLILVLTLIAAKIVRTYAGPSAKQIAAGLAIFSLLNAVFVYICVWFWNTNHPGPIIPQGQLESRMRETLFFCVLTFMLTYGCLLWARLRLGKLQSGLDHIHMLATESGAFDDQD